MKSLLKRVFIPILLAGFLMLYIVIQTSQEYNQWRDSASWQQTESISLFTNIKSSQVRYEYVVNGATYVGDRTHFTVVTNYMDNRHLQWLNDNRQTEQVTVFYNPDHPQQSVLVRDLPDYYWSLVLLRWGITCLSILAPILFFAFIWRKLLQAFRD